MEFLSVRNKCPKSSKTNKKNPLKIVYISNPVRFTTSPDQFRAVVQHLTGRHSTAANLPDAHDEYFTGFPSTSKEAVNGLIPAANSNEIEHRNGGSYGCSSYGDLEAVYNMFEERGASELFVSCDSNRYDYKLARHSMIDEAPFNLGIN